MSSFNVGNTSAGGSSGAFSGITATKIAMPQAGVLQSVTIFWSGNSGVSFFLGVYADSSGAPGALLARSALSTTSGTTQTLTMTTNPTLANGTSYWVAVQNQSNVNGHFNSGGGPGYFMGTPVWTGTSMPDPAPSGTVGAFDFSLYATFNTVTVTLSFPMTIADTSTVSHLDFHAKMHIAMAIADTSTVSHLDVRAGAHIAMAIADTSTISHLDFHAGAHFAFTIADTSTVSALNVRSGAHIPMVIADTSTVLLLRFSISGHFSLTIADITLVSALTFHLIAPPVVTNRPDMETGPSPIPPYCGQNQASQIVTAYPKPPKEIGPIATANAGQPQDSKIVVAYPPPPNETGPIGPIKAAA